MQASQEYRLKIKSELYEVEASLFDDEDKIIENEEFEMQAEPDIMEINALCRFNNESESVSITYDETEISGMEGSSTTLTFNKQNPNTVTMLRTGTVCATLVFEECKRNHTIYQTPYMPFEVSVFTKKVLNNLLSTGILELDYIVEIRGAKAERTKFTMQLLK